MSRTTVVTLEVLGFALAAVIGLFAFGVISTGDSGETPAVSSQAPITEEEQEEEGGAGPAEPDEWFIAQRAAGPGTLDQQDFVRAATHPPGRSLVSIRDSTYIWAAAPA